MSKFLRIVAPFHNIGGYSHAARGLLAAALVAGFTVEAVESETSTVTSIDMDLSLTSGTVPRFPGKPIPACQKAELEQALRTSVPIDAPTILMGNPGMMAEYPEYCAGPRIGYTMLESDTLHPLWAQACRNVDLILAPSRWCVATIRRAVPDVPCDLLPICVDERLWDPGHSDPQLGRMKVAHYQPPFLFLSIFSTCERKGWRKTIQAFAEEFRGENVGLVLKPTRAAEVEELADWVRSMGAWVYIVKGELTDDEIAQLYRACDVYVSPSSEGFGVPLVEAVMCGIPSIALAAGGAADIVTASNGYLVPVEWESCVGQLPQIYPSSHRWPTCSITDLRAAMRRAYDGERYGIGISDVDVVNARAKTSARFSQNAIAFWLNAMETELLPKIKKTLGEHPGKGGKQMPFVAVITTHNNLESTKRTFASLRTHSPGCEIILADDGSTDGTLEWADKQRCLILANNSGGNVSYNRQGAVEYIKNCPGTFPKDPVVVFMDNDVEVMPNWWVDLSSILRARPEIGILAPRKVYGSDTQAASDTSSTPDAETVQNIGNRIYFNGGSAPMRLELPLVYPDYVESACMVVRPEVWRQAEWDAQFPIFYEDVDYCFQARALGFEVCATNTATVTHHAHTTSHTRAAQSDVSRMRFLKKWRDRL